MGWASHIAYKHGFRQVTPKVGCASHANYKHVFRQVTFMVACVSHVNNQHAFRSNVLNGIICYMNDLKSEGLLDHDCYFFFWNARKR